MDADDLKMLYRCLLDELDAAYAARPRDVARIDRIVDDLMCLERTQLALQPRVSQQPLSWLSPTQQRAG